MEERLQFHHKRTTLVVMWQLAYSCSPWPRVPCWPRWSCNDSPLTRGRCADDSATGAPDTCGTNCLTSPPTRTGADGRRLGLIRRVTHDQIGVVLERQKRKRKSRSISSWVACFGQRSHVFCPSSPDFIQGFFLEFFLPLPPLLFEVKATFVHLPLYLYYTILYSPENRFVMPYWVIERGVSQRIHQ